MSCILLYKQMLAETVFFTALYFGWYCLYNYVHFPSMFFWFVLWKNLNTFAQNRFHHQTTCLSHFSSRKCDWLDMGYGCRAVHKNLELWPLITRFSWLLPAAMSRDRPSQNMQIIIPSYWTSNIIHYFVVQFFISLIP